MIAWGLETLFASTLLMLLVLVARAPVRKLVGPQIAYALWALPVLRMLLPPMPESWREAGMAPVAAAGDVIAQYVVLPADLPLLPDPAPEAAIPWIAILLTAWVIGAVGFIGYHMIAYSRFCVRLRRGARSSDWLAEGRVVMIESDAAAGPLAFGVWRKFVAFPADFAERYDEMERDLALAHELGHHARGDLLANWVALTVLAIHWFNPVAWRAFRAFRADQEMACDALVLAGRHPALRHAYGRAIVKSAHGGAVSAACHLHTINEIKGRLRMLTRHQKPSAGRRSAGVAGIATLTLAALAFTASGTEAAEEMKAEVEARTGVSIDAIEMPKLAAIAQAAPVAPRAPVAPEAPTAPQPPHAPSIADAPTAPSVPVAPEAPGVPDAPVPPVPPVAAANGTQHIYRMSDGERTTVIHRRQPLTREQWRKIADAQRAAGEAARRAARVQVPQVTQKNCGGDGPASYTVAGRDGRMVGATIICTDRIERMASRAAIAEKDAMQTAWIAKRGGLASARASIRHARASLMADANLSAEQREHAMAGLDEALREIDAEANSPD